MHISARFMILRAGLLVLIAGTSAQVVPCQAQSNSAVITGELKAIQLPTPQTTGGMTLMQALAQRKTTRAFRDQPLPMQALSNLLWAAFGVNRPREVMSGLGRTAPSAMNSQDIEIDVVLTDGVYIYEAEANRLRAVATGDVRPRVCQPSGAQAAVILVYVAPVNDE